MTDRWVNILQRDVAPRAIAIVFIVLLAWLAYALIRRALLGTMHAASGRVEDPAHRQRIATLVLLLLSIAKYVIIFVAALMILQKLDLNLYPVLAGAGVVGLAVGFGAQNLVRDVVSGFFIIMEGQYAVGDLVEINGAFGRVEEVGLRITRIRDPNGEIRHFPNGSITTANNYVQRHIAYIVTVPFARDATSPSLGQEPAPCSGPAGAADLVKSILNDFDREFQVFAEQPIVGPLEELSTYARLVRAELRCIPGRQSVVEQRLPGRVAAALERVGLPLPAGADVGLALRALPPQPH